MARYYYSATFKVFKEELNTNILGKMAQENKYALIETQRDAWTYEINMLKEALQPFQDGQIFFEYTIPRIGKRVDVILLIKGIVFILEYKVGAKEYLQQDLEQAWDYALDLKNFHERSHDLSIVPILISTEAPLHTFHSFICDADKIYHPLKANAQTIKGLLLDALKNIPQASINASLWGISRYAPTPTIIEAARSLYNNHTVKEITRHDASAENISGTSDYINALIEQARSKNQKCICFVTGVPGAGKTLVGLNIATEQSNKEAGVPAVYLSGNGPLVEVLCEALTRDKVAQLKKEYALKEEKCPTKKDIYSKVKSFIQNVHHYRDAYLEGTLIQDGEIVADLAYFQTEKNRDKSFVPVDHVAIFDEAQRAWTKEMTCKFMAQKKNKLHFPYSEPEFLISCLDRHPDWAVIICLVGGGQEINTGEAGISEWIGVINHKFPHWHIHISDRLTEVEYASGKSLDLICDKKQLTVKSELHLAVSMRSFRAENLSQFIHHLLELNLEKSQTLYKELTQYPIVVTRDIKKAKEWLKKNARGSERFGIVVSSQAYRLRPLAIDVRVKPDTVCWFLNDRQDIRSSYYLEDIATEFDIQGLELDWTCVVWDGDFRFDQNEWKNYAFKGNKWQNIRAQERQTYQKNAYRVLLTRARQGMVIVIPEGDRNDPTRDPSFYDGTYSYLKRIGIQEI